MEEGVYAGGGGIDGELGEGEGGLGGEGEEVFGEGADTARDIL